VSQGKSTTPGSSGRASFTAVEVYVEGGGSSRDEQAEIRRSFAKLFKEALGPRNKPTVIACGGRNQAFKDWKIAVRNHPQTHCLLLVDSEGPVSGGPWEHVRAREGDGWEKPEGCTEEQLHFMVQTMDAWLVADPESLEAHYGQGFRRDALPARRNVEEIPKSQLVDALDRATQDTKKKGRYSKAHGFALIGLIDSARARAAAPHADRFFAHLLSSCAALRAGRGSR
jgi:Domain of unknown function (DUF4276)